MEYTENNLFILITLIFAGFLVISFYVRYKFKSLHKDNFTNQASNGMNGCELVKFLTNKIKMNLEINIIQESFSGNYDPKNKTINLSEDICKSNSLSALSVTAHEIGHVLQDKKGYKLLKFLILLYPLADFGASMSWILILTGILIEQFKLMLAIGIFLLIIAFIYQLLQIPLELDASSRAIKILVKYKLINNKELDKLSEMLDYAALSFLASPAELIFNFVDNIKRRL